MSQICMHAASVPTWATRMPQKSVFVFKGTEWWHHLHPFPSLSTQYETFWGRLCVQPSWPSILFFTTEELIIPLALDQIFQCGVVGDSSRYAFFKVLQCHQHTQKDAWHYRLCVVQWFFLFASGGKTFIFFSCCISPVIHSFFFLTSN